MPDDLIVVDGDQRCHDESSAPQPVSDLGFIVAAEGKAIHITDRIEVVGDLFTDDDHVSSRMSASKGRSERL
jgi:hypothetical protein